MEIGTNRTTLSLVKLEVVMKDYSEVRNAIHEELCDFFNYEFPIQQSGEFDYEYMESITDHIIKLIREQGGNV